MSHVSCFILFQGRHKHSCIKAISIFWLLSSAAVLPRSADNFRLDRRGCREVRRFDKWIWSNASTLLSVSVKKTLLQKMIQVGISVFRAPNQGLESSFCCWTAGQGLAQKECYFHRHRYLSHPACEHLTNTQPLAVVAFELLCVTIFKQIQL